MGDNMLVRVERDGPVTTVIINRPQQRNAVDRPTADALAAAFGEFENDNNARVAVLVGEGGTFCAGADLKGVAEGRVNVHGWLYDKFFITHLSPVNASLAFAIFFTLVIFVLLWPFYRRKIFLRI